MPSSVSPHSIASPTTGSSTAMSASSVCSAPESPIVQTDWGWSVAGTLNYTF
jgi:hypothetical protein